MTSVAEGRLVGMYVIVARTSHGDFTLHQIGPDGGQVRSHAVLASYDVTPEALAAAVRERETSRPRWVWADTAQIYPELLRAGVRVERCVDLRLCHTILRGSSATAGSPFAAAEPSGWDEPPSGHHATPGAAPGGDTHAFPGLDPLFDLDDPVAAEPLDPVAELAAQRAAVAHARATHGPDVAGRLELLLAAESAGALVAAEMTFAGVPWSADRHDELLSDLLGPRPAPGYRPRELENRLALVRAALDAPDLNPDSPPDLLRALRNAGLPARSTRSWELKQIDHPAVAPLLEYKKLARLLTANGWHWLDTWVHEGRFRPVYVPGGVVTGRWASDGGGALQLPHQVRAAVRADPGWRLVVADAAQLEPRILAAMSGDPAMAKAGRGEDMYAGMVAAGAVETRQQAKYGMLGAMYGGTTGESGRMLPRLARAFGRAIALVEEAARTGEQGGVVSTWLGRTSPPPGDAWRLAQGEAFGADGTPDSQRSARSQARAWGRFTRNFVVQGTAAEWALCWMATIRQRLHTLTPTAECAEMAVSSSTHPAETAHSAKGVTSGPHLAFFLHDEVMVHTPAHLADQVVAVLEESAVEAGRLLFGPADRDGVEFRVTTAVVDSYDAAK